MPTKQVFGGEDFLPRIRLKIGTFSQDQDLFFIYLCLTNSLAPDPRAMEWQRDGELSRSDWSALLSALQQGETEHNFAELQRLGEVNISRAG